MKILKIHRLIWIGLILTVPVSVFAQAVVPTFPPDGTTLSFSELQAKGFQWTAPPGAQAFQIFIQGPATFLLKDPLPAAASPLKLDDPIFRVLFTEGNYQWRVRIVEGEGAGSESVVMNFTIGGIPNLRPSPTPSTPIPPSGDVDSSGKIDAQDILRLSAFWGIAAGLPISLFDVSGDSVINIPDLLIYTQKYEQSVPTPTPTPAVGLPTGMTFKPASIMTVQETENLILSWSAPSYPTNTNYQYEIMIVLPTGKELISQDNLSEPTYKPFAELKTTLTGEYQVFLRAKDADGRRSEILVSTFTVNPNPIFTPTPTSVPMDPNIVPDDVTDKLDALAFIAAFGTKDGDLAFNPLADYVTDGIIDRRDLLMFQFLFTHKDTQLAAPQWLYADVPIVGNPPFCVPMKPTDIKYDKVMFPPNELIAAKDNPTCAIAQLSYTQFHFSPVVGAMDYYVSIESEIYGTSFIIFPGQEFFTKGELSFKITRTQPDILLIRVRAVGDGMQFGAMSEVLRAVIPSQGE